MGRLKRWWSNKYKLPPNHSLFVSQSEDELTQAMFEDWMVERESVLEKLKNNDGDGKDLIEHLNLLNKALGEKKGDVVQDDLFESWERDVEEGRIPDLDAMPGSN
jgi:hypothetical protein